MRRIQPARVAANRRFGRFRLEPARDPAGDLGQGRHHRSSRQYGGPGFGKAKSVILLYLQGGPSHLDLWDPKTNVPDNVKSVFSNINTKLPGIQFTENLPKLAKVNDKITMIRSMSYTPIGLFNHTAAIYQMLTGYTADNVSPSGQLEPPSPKDFPNFGCNIVKMRPPEVPMLPYVMMPRPLQESNVIGKAGTAGFLGRAYDPYYLYPPGDDLDMNKMERINIDDLLLRKDVPQARLERRARLRDTVNASLRELDRAVKSYALDTYYDKALSLVLSGRARDAFNLHAEKPEMRDRYGRNTFGQSCLLARRLIEAGTRVVEVNWPKVANSDRHSWDVHVGLSERMKKENSPMLDAGLSALVSDLDERGLLKETLVVAVGEFGRSPKRGREHVRQLQQRRWPRPLAVLLHGRDRRRRDQARTGLRQVRRDGLGSGRESGPSERAVGDHLPQRRPQPAADDL